MADDEKKKAKDEECEEDGHHHGHGDAKEVKEILEVVSEKIPALLNSLTDVLYGKDSAAKYGMAVAGFYKTLKDSGMTDAQAYELTKQYMSSLNLGGIISQAVGSHGGNDDDDDEIGNAVKKKIKMKIEAKTSEKDAE
ncbi:MAG: hypothetical protein HZB92_06250 [Euryarchaeota archaeon]|nr:hypothetical protein [Euryarchaeota archaeon]